MDYLNSCEPSGRNTWDRFLNKYTDVRNFMRVVTKDFVGVNTGGIAFRGRRGYTCEALCPLYLAVIVVLLIVDFNLLKPAFNRDISRIDAGQK